MKLSLTAGTTSKRLRVFVQDKTATDGSGLTGLAYNTSGLIWKYIREDQTAFTTVSKVTASVGTWISSGFVEIGLGVYELGVPDAALVSGKSVQMLLYGATNMAVTAIEIELTAVNNQDGAAFGLSRLDAAITTRAASGSQMDLVSAPNATAITAFQSGLATAANLLTLQTSVSNINNLSALANLFAPATFVRPSSSSIVYPITFVVKDAEGHAVDVDTNTVTLSAANAAGTDRSANLSAVTHAGTGEYTFTYTVASSHADEGLRITAAGTVQTATRKAYANITVADADSLTALAAIQSQTDKLTFTGNFIQADVQDWKGSTAPANTGDAYARIGAAGAGLTNIGNVTVGAYASGQDPATLVLDVSASSHNTSGSIGAKINSAAGGGGGLSGTAQAGSSTTITLAVGASGTDGAYVGQQIIVNEGTASQDVRAIVSYVGSTKVATVNLPWTFTPSNSTPYVLPAINSANVIDVVAN